MSKALFLVSLLSFPIFAAPVNSCWVISEGDSKKLNVPARICIQEMNAYLNGPTVKIQGNPFSLSYQAKAVKTASGLEVSVEPFSRSVGSICSFETQTSIKIDFHQDVVNGQAVGDVRDITIKVEVRDRSDCHVPYDLTTFQYKLE